MDGRTMDDGITISFNIYNTPHHMIRRAVLSILGQTYQGWRLLMVNDGGDPRCWDALDGIDDERIECLNFDENLGTYARHAQTLALCKTRWWSPHDSDDYVSSDRYATLINSATDEHDVVLAGYTNIRGDGTVQARPVRDGKVGENGWGINATVWGGTLWRADWLRSVGGFDTSYRTTYDTALQTLAFRFGRVLRVSHLGYFRDYTPTSLTKCLRTGHGSLYRQKTQEHIGKKIGMLRNDMTHEQIAAIMNTGDFDCDTRVLSDIPIRIVANIICLDSEPELPATLDSLTPATVDCPESGRHVRHGVDGVVMVDGGSSDKTVDIARGWSRSGLPVDVSVHGWEDDFAKQRNICLEETRKRYGCTTEGEEVWVLMIDSDDTLSVFDRPYVEKIIRECGVDAISVRMDNGGSHYEAVQLFRLKADTEWRNPIHEYVHFGGAKAILPNGCLTITRGRAKRHDADPLRNVRIGRRFVEKSPCDKRGRFYLARDTMECAALGFMDRMAAAEGHLRTYLSLPGGFPEQDRHARLLLCHILWVTGRSDEARRLMLDSLMYDPNNKSAYLALAGMTDPDCGAVWRKLSDSVDGDCVLPYTAKLPQPR